MAIAVGSCVSPKITFVTPVHSGKPPTLGVVNNNAAPWDVLWDSGVLAEGLLATSLDEILGAGDDAIAKVGCRVQVDEYPNWGLCTVVGALKRVTTDKLVLQNQFGYFIEVAASDCTVVS